MELQATLDAARSAIESANSLAELDEVRVHYMGKKGQFTELLKGLGKLSAEERPQAGQAINEAKQSFQSLLNARRDSLQQAALSEKLEAERIDVSLPGTNVQQGYLHPVTQTIQRIEHYFGQLGFEVKKGPEVEDDFHNFDALNIPTNHPARADHGYILIFTPRIQC